MSTIDLRHGDCLELMKSIPDKSIDMVLTDPPYGTTACKWDVVIPFDLMWAELKRITKPNSPIVLFGSQPFSSTLIVSNILDFKYQWVWDKVKASGHLNAKLRPMLQHEDVIVFSQGRVSYNPQGLIYGDFNNSRPAKGKQKQDTTYQKNSTHSLSKAANYPKSIIEFSKPGDRERLHPTQKPVELLEYLIKTYTLEGESVLDFTMGSGSTGVACKNLNRNFIGIELDDKYFQIAKDRIDKA